ncbi:acetoin dehydrogenase dihydrolipoyllysine-residue acetyltransferase subunit [Pseudoxanthobacter sp.]|uniref:acetoin dehydrogenase dihydrolipoyllysine-residue acetyltransferase subunit n=1 Tax=Pseudoxanthobacter sp. TaxID=1925742 RepID=UPI002FDF557C
MNARIKPIVMPKWGLSMSEGKVTGWLKRPGAKIDVGDEIVEVETDKIAGVVEAGDAGLLRRILGEPNTVYPVKALIGVVADADVPDAEIDAFVAGYATPSEEGGEEESGPKYEFADTPAGRLRYADRGSGSETVILIHGFGGDLDNWLFNIDALAAKARVIALDLPGHGQSDKAVKGAGLAGLSEAVTGVMDAAGVTKAHLVGHSMGGAVALKIAATHPERVASLTLIGSAGLGAEINGDYLAAFVRASSRREMKPLLEQLFEDAGLVSRHLVDDIVKYKRIDGVEEALGAISAAVFPGGRQAEVLAATPGLPPVLVIWGAGDRIIPAAHAGAIAGAKSEVIPGAGHMVQMEKAHHVNDLIVAHIAG